MLYRYVVSLGHVWGSKYPIENTCQLSEVHSILFNILIKFTERSRIVVLQLGIVCQLHIVNAQFEEVMCQTEYGFGTVLWTHFSCVKAP